MQQHQRLGRQQLQLPPRRMLIHRAVLALGYFRSALLRQELQVSSRSRQRRRGWGEALACALAAAPRAALLRVGQAPARTHRQLQHRLVGYPAVRLLLELQLPALLQLHLRPLLRSLRQGKVPSFPPPPRCNQPFSRLLCRPSRLLWLARRLQLPVRTDRPQQASCHLFPLEAAQAWRLCSHGAPPLQTRLLQPRLPLQLLEQQPLLLPLVRLLRLDQLLLQCFLQG